MDTPRHPWDARYGTDGFLFGTRPNDFLAEVADRIPSGGRVLCIGDGEGRNGVHLATLGHAVTSLDLSAVGLAKARRLAAERGTVIDTVQADLDDHDLGTGWHAIVSIFCHLPSALRRRRYPTFHAALAPGGCVILEAYTPDQIGRGTGGPPDPDLLCTQAELRELFGGLMLEHLTEIERDVIEGTGHTGMASVVQLLAFRN